MGDIWPHLLRPWWLLLLPLPIWLLWRLWHRQRNTGHWQRLLPPSFQAVLLTRGRLRGTRLPWVVLGLTWLLALLALLGPSWQRLEQPSLKRVDPLIVLLEMTPAMLAEDVLPNRLEQAKRKLIDLLQTRRDVQTAIVVFAGSAHVLVPLSDDLATIDNLLKVLKPSLMPETGHRADLAVARGLALLQQGGAGRGRLLLVGSTLDENERQSIHKQLLNFSGQLALLGIGTTEGAPILKEDGSYLRDEQGSILIPRLDDKALAQLASESNGSYRTATLDNSDLAGLGLLAANGGIGESAETISLRAWVDQGYWLLLPLLLLAASAGRRGWLFCLPLLLLPGEPAQAADWQKLWLRPDQQGLRLLEEQRPAQAARRFEDRQWQGLALYRAGDYKGAAERFSQENSAPAHYNRGNALAMDKQLEAALEAYDRALALQPELAEAQHNRALVEALLKQRQQAESDTTNQSPESRSDEQALSSSAQANLPERSQKPSSANETDERDVQQANRPATGTDPFAQKKSVSGAAANRQADYRLEITEGQQELEQWLRQISDDPGELLRRKFLYEQRRQQEVKP
ncbi:VWA domain-containing protein [Azomonas macrocytogenes]|uniref:Ca-activated chloride channel family protein n=1 Tax=Azomonas macrocytogenes TaxID=69962 RepID=A0A839T8F4_AZOMA|nr:VWA domain-containing protein [Azomonas macrocytogenes]MBB3104736.1 Ca-activated chloride channel family protein [Azomonas macrocytogenes]